MMNPFRARKPSNFDGRTANSTSRNGNETIAMGNLNRDHALTFEDNQGVEVVTIPDRFHESESEEEDDINEPVEVVMGAGGRMRTYAATIFQSSKKSTLMIGLSMIIFFVFFLAGIGGIVSNNRTAAVMSSALITSDCPESSKTSKSTSMSYGGKGGKTPERRLSTKKSSKAPTSKSSKSPTSKSSKVSKCKVSKAPTSKSPKAPSKASKAPTTPSPTGTPTPPQPTVSPTNPIPTKSPTNAPTNAPTNPQPTVSPTNPIPTKSPTNAPTNPPGVTPAPQTPSPTSFSPGIPQCSNFPSDCLCGSCTDAVTCVFNLNAGKKKKADALCIKPLEVGTCATTDNELSVAIKPGGEKKSKIVDEFSVAIKPKESDCDDKFPVEFNNDPSKCPGGWLIARPESCKPVNSWEVKAKCVNNNQEVKIHSSCSCEIGMCYTYPNVTPLYVITGYNTTADPNKWYYDDCLSTTPSPSPENCDAD